MKKSIENLVLSLRLDGDITFCLDDSPKAYGSVAVCCDGRMIGRMSRKDAEKHVLHCRKNDRYRYVARLSRVDMNKNILVRIGIYEKVDWSEYMFAGKFPLCNVCLSRDEYEHIKKDNVLSVIEDCHQCDYENEEMETCLNVFDDQIKTDIWVRLRQNSMSLMTSLMVIICWQNLCPGIRMEKKSLLVFISRDGTAGMIRYNKIGVKP